MIKKFTKFLLLLFIIGLSLGALAHADTVTDTTPANPVVASGSAALYIADNDGSPRIRVFGWTGTTWSASGHTAVSLTAGEKVYGLAVNSAGDKLYASISNGSASSVVVYDLDGSGDVTATTVLSGSYPTGSSPSGLALNESANRLYVADNGLKGVRIYNTSTNAQVAYVTGMSDGHVGVAFSASQNKVFVTNKGVTGRIHVYDVSGGTLTYNSSITNTNLVYPTHILTSGDQVYVAVNAYAGIDVQVYNATSHAHVADVSNSDGITGRYGHVAIALTPDGSRLIFKKAVDAIQTSSYLFSARTDNLASVTKLVLDTTDDKVNRSDGLVVSLSNTKIAVTNSPTGGIQIVAPNYAASNQDPDLSALQQYKMDGTTVIAPEGTTDEDSIIVKFTVTDPDGDSVTPEVRYWLYETEDAVDGTTIVVPPDVSGTEFVVTIPETGGLADDSYAWRVRATDGTEYSPWRDFNNGAPVDFIVDTTNDPPGTFGKISPADSNDECCDVYLQWTASTDPDVLDTLTYHVLVYNAGDYVTPVVDVTTTETNYSILAGLVVGNTYEWNISVTDGTNTVWADGAEETRWSFTYIESITNPGNPFITNTSPLDAATDVNIDAAVTITFNESIQSSTFTYTVAPAVTGTSVSWNPTHTVATIAHDDFAMTTPYLVTVTNADDVDESLPLTGDNDFAFTTGTGSGSTDPVVNIVITREADTPGSDITITWDTVPPGLGVDVYELLCTYDGVLEVYDRYFETATTNWTPVATNVTIGTYTISSSVGDGTARYYKLIPNGDTLETGDLTTEVVAKFDIAVGPSDTEPERFFISIPIEVADTSVTSIIGGQVEETDMILSFDIDKNVTYGSMYSSSTWVTFPGAIGPITDIYAGYTYGYYTPTAKYITAVGMVPEATYNRTLDGGVTPVSNWIANPFPSPVAIADAGLNSSSFVTALIDIVDAAVIYNFDANAELIDTTNGLAFHYPSAPEWYEGSLSGSSPLEMVPGKGYMFTEPIQGAFTWTLVNPY